MSETQIVQYSIQVQSSEAINAINNFKKSVDTLTTLDTQIKASAKTISTEFEALRRSVCAEMDAIQKKANIKVILDTTEAKGKLKALKDYTVSINIDTTEANRKIDGLLTKIEKLQQNANITIKAKGLGSKSSDNSSSSASATPSVTQTVVQQSAQAASIQEAHDRAAQSTTITTSSVTPSLVEEKSKKGGRKKKDRGAARRARAEQKQAQTQPTIATAPVVSTTQSVISNRDLFVSSKSPYLLPSTNKASVNIESGQPPKPPKNQPKKHTTSAGDESSEKWVKDFNKRLKKVSSYSVLGPSMLDSGGSPVLNMLKGIGLTYGLGGVGTVLGDALRESVEYDNIMRTTHNILSVHDKRSDFNSRFHDMEKISRNVGVQTKFTSSEVADATKFLAMAGYNVDEISASIRAIADIALVGDTALGETADLVTNVMTGYDINPSRLREVADKMTMTFTSTNTTLPEIAEAYKYSASLLSAGGVSFDEATAAIGVLGDAGIKGSQAGTTLRTILSNIIFPRGKKRIKAWEDTGVKLYREDGNMRSILEIFKDLNAKGVNAQDAFGLFDKTAAQGAVALLNHVDKWNEVVEKNFMSTDVSRRLAEEKKNTISGMWAQLTSTFTEGALQAFETLKEPLKQTIGNVIEGLKSDAFKNAILTIGSTLLNVVRTLKELTAKMYEFYDTFKGLIDWWLKTQIKLLPVLVVGRVIRGFSMLISNAAKFGIQLADIYRTLTGIKNISEFISIVKPRVLGVAGLDGESGSSSGNNKPNYKYGSSLIGMSLGAILGGTLGSQVSDNEYAGTAGGVLGAIAGGVLGHPEVLNVIKKYTAPKLQVARHALENIKPYIAKPFTYASTVAGGLGGASLGSYLTDGNIFGTVAGAAVGSVGSAAFSKMLMGVAGVPYLGAIAAGTVALAGLAAYLRNVSEEANRGAEAFHNFINSTNRINGIDYSKSATYMDRYYQVVYNKQLSINEAVEKHIELIKERMGLQTPSDDPEKSPKLIDTHPEAINGILENTGFFGGKVLRGHMNLLKNNTSLYDPLVVNGVPYNSGYIDQTKVKHYAFAKFLNQLADISNSDSEAHKVSQEYRMRLLRAASPKDYQVLVDELKSSKIPGYMKNAKSVQFDNSLIDNEESTLAQAKQTRQYAIRTTSDLNSYFFGNTPTAELFRTHETILSNIEKGVTTPLEDLQKYLYLSGVGNMNPAFGEFGSQQYMERWGYKNGKWQSFEAIYDKNGKLIQSARTAEESRQLFMGFFDELKRVLNGVSDAIRSQFTGIVNASTWDLANPDVPKAGATTILNGETFTWQGAPSLTPGWTNKNGKTMSYAEMKRQQELASSATVNGTDTTSKKTSYGSPYSKYNPTPKQINVRIENLMNVEAIDLSDPNNVSTVENIKSQLAQALIDVVHDFDKSFS